MELKDWARTEARRYYHDVERTTSFPTVYYTLINFADEMMTRQEAAAPRSRTRSHTAAPAAAPAPTRALQRDQAIVANVIGSQNEAEQRVRASLAREAEQRKGRAALNRILFREYSSWWDAFVAEADEDADRNAPSASDRFSWHCAKILGRQTGIRHEEIAPVVAAWVLEHTE
jgi:hypothetical protein